MRLRSVLKNIRKRRAVRKSINIKKVISSLAIATTVCLTPAYAQQVVIDGNTATKLDVNSNVTTVTTTTFKGPNAFNSFYKFNVTSGNIVNLVVPDSSSNLINLVHDESTTINGVLNSVKNGHIGGNVFLVNPHGITVGSQGVVNVGSLTAVTPTTNYMNNFFDAPGIPNDASVISLLNGTLPVNPDASITNEGTINAIENVKLDTGNFTSTGDIYSGAVFKENDIDMGDVVNLNTLKSGSEMAVNSGEIVIKAAGDAINSGNIVADGGNNVDAGSVSIKAGNDVVLEEGSLVSAKGKGDNSAGGDVYVRGDNDAYFYPTATLDARGGEVSGNAGIVELSADNTVYVGGDFKATATNGETGTIIIDPLYLDSVKYTGSGYVNDGLIYTDGANLVISDPDSISADSMIISTRKIAAGSGGNQFNDPSTGSSGYLTLESQVIDMLGVNVLTHGSDGYNSGDITIHAAASGYTNSSIHIGSFSYFTAGNANIYIKADDANTSSKAGSIVLNDSSFCANRIELLAEAGNDAIDFEVGNASIIITDGQLYANELDFQATGKNTASYDPFANSDAKIIITDGSIINGYKSVNMIANAGNGFSSDARIQLVDVNMKSANADFDINTGDSYSAMGALIGNNFNFSAGTLDIDTSSEHGTTLITLDSASTVTSGSFAKQLIVNADGTINTATSKIGATNNSNVVTGNAGTQYVSLTADSVTGDATINLYRGYSSIDIQNNSDLDLYLNKLETEQNGFFKLNGTNYDTYGNFIININEDYTPKTITIENNTSSDIYLQDTIYNADSTASITNSGGDLFNNVSGLISAQGITLSTPAGSIGIGDDIDIELLNDSSLTANALNSIAVKATDFDLITGNVTAEDNISLIVQNGDLKQDPATDVTLGGSLTLRAISGSIGDAATPFVVDSSTGLFVDIDSDGVANIQQIGGDINLAGGNNNTGDTYLSTINGSIYGAGYLLVTGNTLEINAGGTGSYIDFADVELWGEATVDASADGYIDLAFYNYNVNLGLVESFSDDMTISLTPNYNILKNASGTNVRGVNITLNSGGSLGSVANAIGIDLQGGVLNATAADVLNVREQTGDLNFDQVESTNNDVYLSTVDGSILETTDDAIDAYSLYLYAGGTGSTIGTVTDQLEINLSGGSFTAYADGVINVQETSGTFNVDHVESFSDDVYLEAYYGSLIDTSGATVVGEDITLNAYGYGSSIGTVGTAFNVELQGGELNAFANDIVNINAISGDLNAGEVESLNSNVYLSTTDGSILGDASSLVDGNDLKFDANGTGRSIGTDIQPLLINSNTSLKAYASGLINLQAPAGHLNLKEVISYSGDVTLTADLGNITDAPGSANDIVVANNLTLNAPGGSIGQADDIDSVTRGSGVLNAVANGYIKIQNNATNSSKRDFNVGQVESYSSTVLLQSIYGSLLDANPTEDPNVIAPTVMLDADDTLGTAADDFNVQASTLVDYASGDDGVYLTQNTGNLTVDYIRSAYNDIYLNVPEGSLYDTATTDIRGIDIHLDAGGYLGTIGTAGNTFSINLQGGRLTANAEGLINIRETSGNLVYTLVDSATNANISLAASNGSIRESAPTTLVGSNITLSANNGSIGASDDTIDIDILGGNLTASAGNVINITEINGDLSVNGVTSTGGQVTLTSANGNITGNGTVTGSGISLYAETPGKAVGYSDWLHVNQTGGEFTALSDDHMYIMADNNNIVVNQIESYNSGVEIYLVNGSILNGASALVTGENVNITANLGSIGASGNPLNIDTKGLYFHPYANDSIYVNEVSGDLEIWWAEAENGTFFASTTDGSILRYADDITSGTDMTFDANGAGNTIGTLAEPLEVEAGGGFKAYADGIVNIHSTSGNLNLKEVISYSNDVKLITDTGNITDAPGSANDIVVANNLTLNAPGGSIGQADDIDSVTRGSGVLNAVANGYIKIQNNATNSSKRDFNVGQVESYSSTVLLQSIYGSLLDASPTEDPNVIASTVMLDADGTIGTAANDFNIIASTILDYASGDDGVYLTQNTGNLTVDYLRSAYDDVYITALDGSIFDTATTDIRAIDINLNALGYAGTIGTGGNTFTVNLQGGALSATAEGQIHITESSGNMKLGHVESLTNNVTLIAANGSIPESTNTTVVGNNITLKANSGSIGTGTKTVYIDLLGGNLVANANGVINVTETDGDLLIDQAISATNADIYLSATNGSVIENQGDPIVGTNIYLYAGGTGSIGTAGDVFDIDLQGGALTAYADGLINIEEQTGDLLSYHVESYSDDVILSTIYGSILESSPTTVAGVNITLNAVGSGSTIGDAGNTFHIDLKDYGYGTGSLTATADGIINITEIDGDMALETVNSYYGDVSLAASNGSILDASEDEAPNIIGTNITFYAPGGSIGSLGYDGDIDIDLQSSALNAIAGNLINIEELDSDIELGLLETNGDTYLSTPGVINNTPGGLVIANNATLDAYAIYGYLIFDVDTSTTITTDGDTYISGNVGNLNISAANAYLESVYANDLIANVDNDFIFNMGSTNNATINTLGYSTVSIDYTFVTGNLDIDNFYGYTSFMGMINGTATIQNSDIVDFEVANGNLNVNQIVGYTQVEVDTDYGSLLDASPAEDANFITDTLTLYAYGSIGTELEDIDTDLSNNPLNALAANGPVNIEELSGDLYLDELKSLTDDVYLSTPDGSIAETVNTDLSGVNIYLNAGGYLSTIGTSVDDFPIDLQGGALSAMADGTINITELTGDLIVDHVESVTDDVYLATNDDSILKGNEGIIIANNIELNSFSYIGSSEDYLKTDLQGGGLTAYATDDIFINEIDGDVQLFTMQSAYGANLLVDNGNILSGQPGNNVFGYGITLEAPYGFIGTDVNPLDIRSQDDGFNALSSGDIFIIQTTGTLRLDVVQSNNGNVSLISTSGSIVDAQWPDSDNVIAQNISLYAPNGTIGSGSADVDIVINGGFVDATANGIINLSSNNTDLVVDHVESYSDDVYLSAYNGNIVDNSSDTIIGYNIYLQTYYGGSIGTPDEVLNIDLQGGMLTAYAEGIVNINENTGDLIVNHAESYNDDVILSTTNGNILGSYPVIIGTNITLIANGEGSTIGEVANPVETDLQGGVLNATADGLININETDGDMNVEVIRSLSDDLYLDTDNGSILDGELSDNANVIADELFLDIYSGSLGTLGDDFVVDLTTAVLNFDLSGDVNLTLVSGDILLDQIESTNGSVLLTANDGSILDNSAGEAPNVIAEDITLNAPMGSVGTAVEDIDIDLTASTLNSLANVVINIEELDSNIDLGKLESTTNIYLKTPGDINDNNGVENNFVADTVTIDASNIGDGYSSVGFDITSSTDINATGNTYLTGYFGDLNVTADEVYMGIYGDLHLGLIDATSVTLEMHDNSDIYDANADSTNIQADSLVINQAGNIYDFLDLYIAYDSNINTSGTTELKGVGGTFTANVGDLTYNNAMAVGIDVIATDFVDINNALVFTNVVANAGGDVDVDGAVFQKYDLTGNNVTITSANNVNIQLIDAVGDASVTTPQNINVTGLIQAGQTGSSENTLIVNGDGSIDPSSTIGATVGGGNVDVDNFSAGNNGGVIDLTGDVTGTGTLEALGGPGDINITNNSTNTLIINDLSLTGTPGQIIVNGNPVTEDFDNITVIVNETGSGEINILSSNISINGTITNLGGPVNFSHSFNIVSPTGIIDTSELNFTNMYYSEMERHIEIDSTDAVVNLFTGDFLTLTELDGDLLVGFFESDPDYGDSIIRLNTVNGNIIDALPGEGPNIITNNLVFDNINGSVGTLSDDLNIQSNNNEIEVWSLSPASGDINLFSDNSDFIIRSYDLDLNSLNGSIIISAPDNSILIDWSQTLTAKNNIELYAKDITINTVLGSGVLNAGNNIVISPSNSLDFQASVYADGSLTINGGDILNHGIRFIGGGIAAASLQSDFLTQNGPINITSNSNVTIGNFGFTHINGEAFVPTSMNINASGDVRIIGGDEFSLPTCISESLTVNSAQNVFIDGEIIVGGNNLPDYSLIVNSDNTIDPSSTIGATIAGGNIDVDNFNKAGDGGLINITGNIQGDTGDPWYPSILRVVGGTGGITITNNSNNSLTLNDLTISGNDPGVTINGNPVTETINDVHIYIDKDEIYTRNNSSTDTILAGNINNTQGLVKFYNHYSNGGSLLNQGGLITAHDITFAANNGGIGGVSNPVQIDLQGGALTANAGTDINIAETTGDLNVNQVTAVNNVKLTSTDGSILDAKGDKTANVIGDNLTFTTLNGSIGTQPDPLYVRATGNVNANSANGVYIVHSGPAVNLTLGNIETSANDIIIFNPEATGNINVAGTIENTAGVINIRNTCGNIVSFGGLISGPDITIQADNGTIGSAANYIEFYLDNSTLNIQGYGDVYAESNYAGNTYSAKSITGMAHLRSAPAQKPSLMVPPLLLPVLNETPEIIIAEPVKIVTIKEPEEIVVINEEPVEIITIEEPVENSIINKEPEIVIETPVEPVITIKQETENTQQIDDYNQQINNQPEIVVNSVEPYIPESLTMVLEDTIVEMPEITVQENPEINIKDTIPASLIGAELGIIKPINMQTLEFNLLEPLIDYENDLNIYINYNTTGGSLFANPIEVDASSTVTANSPDNHVHEN